MAHEEKDMQGALFINKRKQLKTHPDRQGTITIEGRRFELSGWINTSDRTGDVWLSLRAKPYVDRSAERDGRGDEVQNKPMPF